MLHAPQQASPLDRMDTPPSIQVVPLDDDQQHMTRSPSTTGTAYAIQYGSFAAFTSGRNVRSSPAAPLWRVTVPLSIRTWASAAGASVSDKSTNNPIALRSIAGSLCVLCLLCVLCVLCVNYFSMISIR